MRSRSRSPRADRTHRSRSRSRDRRCSRHHGEQAPRNTRARDDSTASDRKTPTPIRLDKVDHLPPWRASLDEFGDVRHVPFQTLDSAEVDAECERILAALDFDASGPGAVPARGVPLVVGVQNSSHCPLVSGLLDLDDPSTVFTTKSTVAFSNVEPVVRGGHAPLPAQAREPDPRELLFAPAPTTSRRLRPTGSSSKHEPDVSPSLKCAAH